MIYMYIYMGLMLTKEKMKTPNNIQDIIKAELSYLQTRVQVYDFKSGNILALWFLTSIHLKLFQQVLHSGS